MNNGYTPRHARRDTTETRKAIRAQRALQHQINHGIKPDARQNNQAFVALINQVAANLAAKDAEPSTFPAETPEAVAA